MREHIYFHGGGTNKQTTENAKVEASLNLRFAESGTKKGKEKGKEPVKKDRLRLSFFHWCVDTNQRADTNQCAYTKLRPYTHVHSTNYILC